MRSLANIARARGGLRLIATVCFLQGSSVAPALSVAALPGTREGAWNDMLSAPIQVQAQITATPARSFGPWNTLCAADAIVLQSFKGQGILPVGSRFRFTWSCWGAGHWFITGFREFVHPNAALDQVDGLAKGQNVELILKSIDWLKGSVLQAAHIQKVAAPTKAPTFVPVRFPSWYDRSFAPGGSNNRTVTSVPESATARPPIFPLRDVTLTYTTSSAPGRVFAAAYDATMHRVLIQQKSNGTGLTERQVEDPVVGLTTRIWDRSRTYTIKQYNDAITDMIASSFYFIPFKVVGHEHIAGLQCDDYQFPASSGETIAACITRDGLRLKRVENGIATTATSVSYGPVSAESSIVPDGYLRVPADDDRTKRSPPNPSD